MIVKTDREHILRITIGISLSAILLLTGLVNAQCPTNGENYSNLFVGIGVNKESFVPYETITLSAYVLDNGTPLSKMNVTADISRPDGTNNTIQLYDDGFHEDSKTDDGIYANIYTNTNVSGIYHITVFANGMVRNETFERKAFKNVMVGLYPDLTITSSGIHFSNATGQNITINATIHNIGDASANNASILFYDGDPVSGVLIGKDIINVSAGQTNIASISINVPAGQHYIYVYISPFNQFLEKDYTNNKASKILGIVVHTDKKYYYQGEHVNITLENNYPNTVHIVIGNNSCDRFKIYNVDNNTYIDLIGKLFCAQVILEQDVPSGASIEEIWNQKDGYGNQIPNGRYRAAIGNYYSDIFIIEKNDTVLIS